MADTILHSPQHALSKNGIEAHVVTFAALAHKKAHDETGMKSADQEISHVVHVNIQWSTAAFWWAFALAFPAVFALLLRPVEPQDYGSLRGLFATLRDHSSTSRIVGWGLVYLALAALLYWVLVSWHRSKPE